MENCNCSNTISKFVLRRCTTGFFKITYNEKYRFATLHSFGCTFHCDVGGGLGWKTSGQPGRIVI
jgi:hypothetical protein